MPITAAKQSIGASGRATSKGLKMVTLQVEAGTLKASSFKVLRSRRHDVTRMLGEYVKAVTDADARGERAELTIVVEPTRAPGALAASYGDQLAAARARGARRVAEILNEPAMLSSDAIGELLGASRDTVNQRRRAGELLGLEGATRGVRYPSWQLTQDGRPLPGLADIGRVLGGDPWSVYRFLLDPHPELESMTGLEALKAGRMEDTLLTAEAIGHGSFA